MKQLIFLLFLRIIPDDDCRILPVGANTNQCAIQLIVFVNE